ncbi:MAG: helix-hairpin-helix domain-containing protein [Armatimonadota bacterium]
MRKGLGGFGTSPFGFANQVHLQTGTEAETVLLSRKLARRQSESGAILIISIFVLAALVGLVVSLSQATRIEMRAARNFAAELQSRALADAGVYLAAVTLQNDQTPYVDSEDDDWYLLGENGAAEYELGEGTYRVQIVDACARLDVNRATRDELLMLPGMTEEIADAIIDWRDADDEPSEAGAESDVYETFPTPYRTRNGPFQSLDELLLVSRVTPSLLYGTPAGQAVEPTANTDKPWCELLTVRSNSPEVTADGQSRLDINQATIEQLLQLPVGLTQQQAQAIIARRQQTQFTSLGTLFTVAGIPTETAAQLIDYVKIGGANQSSGKININTAPEDVLTLLPDMTSDIAAAIVANRPYQSVGELLTNGVVDSQVFQRVVDRLTTKSSSFIVRSIGRLNPGGIYVAEEAMVERSGGRATVVSRREVKRWPGWVSWGWEAPSGEPTAPPATSAPVLGMSR